METSIIYNWSQFAAEFTLVGLASVILMADCFLKQMPKSYYALLGAAGAIEALACLFVLNEGIIPPTINLNEQDENCDLNYVPNVAVRADVTLALSNSLGFGGHNACLAFRKV